MVTQDGPLIRLTGVSHSYPLPGEGSKTSLRGVDLSVRSGEKLVILGAGGAGKTTLSLVLAGVLHGAEGVRMVGGGLGPGEAGSFPIGLVSQNPEDTFTSPVVREEMGLILQNYGREEAVIDGLVDEMLDEIGLAGHADSPPSLLSGGQKQLLALASVVIADPRMLILDEPLSLLDRRGRHEVSALLDRWSASPLRTIILLSSEVEDALAGDRVAVLAGGRIVWEGSPDALPLSAGELGRWGLVPPDLVLLAHRLEDCGIPCPVKLWTPEKMAEELCRSD